MSEAQVTAPLTGAAAAGKGRRQKALRRPRVAQTTWRSFVTPEGVDLGLHVSEAGARIAALMLDVMCIGLMLVVLTIGSCAAMIGQGVVGGGRGGAGTQVVLVVWVLCAFLLRNFYFTGFELGARAATPGKRALGLRVIARDGGRLTAGAVFVRNVSRELELFTPTTLLAASHPDGWMVLLGVVWTGVFLLFPLFNRDRLRIGDLIAGTMVVKAPRRVLAPDLADSDAARYGAVRFTPAQVDAYGIKELHVLEEVLRRNDRRTMADVARRIRGKIGWPDPPAEADRVFLDAYYAALRARLETRLLLGRRRRDKFDVG